MYARSTRILLASLVGFSWWTPFVRGAEYDSTGMAAQVAAKHLTLEAIEYRLSGDQRLSATKLAAAISLDPNCELARWQSGQMRWNNQWMTADEMSAVVATDDIYQSYLERRNGLAGNTVAELRLADWCERNSLDDQARFHYTQVANASAAKPQDRTAALEALGYVIDRGTWVKQADIQARQQQVEQERRAAQRWTNKVRGWGETLSRGDNEKSTKVRDEMDSVDDLAIIPVLERQLSLASPQLASETVRWLDRRKDHAATQSLVRHALIVPWPDVAQAAIDALASRSPHDFVPELLEFLVAPVEVDSQVIVTPRGDFIARTDLLQAGRTQNIANRIDFAANVRRRSIPLVARRSDINGTQAGSAVDPAIEARRFSDASDVDTFDVMSVLRQQFALEQNVAQLNGAISGHNRRILDILEGATEAATGDRPESSWEWWSEYTDEYVPPKETSYSYQNNVAYRPRCECFIAGTLVRTEMGLIAIDKIHPGARVLAQNIDTGELSYKLVQAVTVRPPTRVMDVVAEGTHIVSTQGHPFWVNGQGWKMARQLEVGDVLHTLRGSAIVQELNIRDVPEPVFNLVVDDFNTYFVGPTDVLVHDNLPRRPTMAVTPGHVVEQLSAQSMSVR